MDVGKFILSVKNREETFDASRCEHRTRDNIASVWLKICRGDGRGLVERFGVLLLNLMTTMMLFITTKTTAPLTTVIMLLGLLFNVFICRFWCGKK